jgi:hypothetical protein
LEEPLTDIAKTCGRCAATIYLVRTGDHYKWLTNPEKENTWHCGNDILHPELAHAPNEELRLTGARR